MGDKKTLRKRSEVDDAKSATDFPRAKNGDGIELVCSECGKPQHITPSGSSCENGHGGVDGITDDEWIKTRHDARVIPRIKGEIKKAAKPPELFMKVNGSDKRLPWVSDDFGAIVESTFVEEPLRIYERLIKELSIGEQRANYAVVNAALDRAEENARLAFRLYLTAKYEAEKYELDLAPINATIRENATLDLQSEKNDGERAKAITNGDVDARAQTMYPDHCRAIGDGRRKVKSMVASCAKLADLWKSRCRSLEVMLQSMRK